MEELVKKRIWLRPGISGTLASTNVNEHLHQLKQDVTHRNHVRRLETRLPGVHLAVLEASSPCSTPFCDGACTASLRVTFYIDADIASHHTKVAASPREIGGISTGDQSLRGDAASVAQVPPKRWRSIIATLRPAAVRRYASGGPACPVPMMIAS